MRRTLAGRPQCGACRRRGHPSRHPRILAGTAAASRPAEQTPRHIANAMRPRKHSVSIALWVWALERYAAVASLAVLPAEQAWLAGSGRKSVVVGMIPQSALPSYWISNMGCIQEGESNPCHRESNENNLLLLVMGGVARRKHQLCLRTPRTERALVW
jgi:hypothetical protein